MLQEQSEITGIPSLKISSNNVFGYYIEVRNTHKDKVPEDWIRKQTLVNAERYITDDLKQYESKILGAEEKILQLEIQIFQELIAKIYRYILSVQKNSSIISELDCLTSFAQIAKDTDQYYVNYRWLGGMLTNWGTISASIKKLKKIEIDLVSENRGFTKKELLKMSVQRDKLQRSLGGIAEMKKIPDLVFIIDTNYESLAIKESIKLRIPIVAILDSNSNPEGIEFPIPGNDDARRSIDLYCSLIKETIQNAKKAAPAIDEEILATKNKQKDDKSKTVQDTDREKLDAKFSKKEKPKLNQHE